MCDDTSDPLDRLTGEEIRDLATKGWLTHDGMWFDQAARLLGIDRATLYNKMRKYGIERTE